MSEVAVRVLAVGLAAVFAWAAVSKIALRAQWRASLGAYGLGGLTAPIAVAVPTGEIAIALSFFVLPVGAAAATALAALAVFSLGLLRARSLRGDRLPCGCFGKTKERDYRALLVRNAALGVVAAIVAAGGRTAHVLEGAGLPEAGEMVPAALVMVGVVVVGWTLVSISASFRNDGKDNG